MVARWLPARARKDQGDKGLKFGDLRQMTLGRQRRLAGTEPMQFFHPGGISFRLARKTP
jgi:hypothetical protein